MNEIVTHESDPARSVNDALMGALAKACATGQECYLLIDASKSHEIQYMIEGLTDDALCLFDGEVFEELSAYAPWLVPLSGAGSDVFKWFMKKGWGKDWGLFLISDADPVRVKASLRRSLRVNTEDGRELFFKFYRPSVFNLYMPAMDPLQVTQVMQNLAQVWTEDEKDPALIHRYAVRGSSLRRADLTLKLVEDV
ncbi:DUF4123 domain-containing protein [Sagittula salina]|uniref:DUF4123 domain-containing protein n=1 Tax=Sagittula salina TaxID=2820268 RepID=A0A940MTY4_9RHOB|nr:DUF4123 domain-containing protein [Sagittula salina]MBP0485002.1 DUF4123 domain-containing protein [Sagittula salina]